MSSSVPQGAAAPVVLTKQQFRSAITAALTVILLGALDQTIVSVSVPTIAKQLGGFEWMAWVISAYLIASTVVTPIYGKFSDLFGRRRLILAAIGIFFFASAACALAQSLPQLVLARVAQGIGGGGLIAMAQSMIADVVPMHERGKFQVYVSGVWAGASVAGPVVGGMLTQYLSWPWIFWVNLPVCLAAVHLVRRTGMASHKVARKVRIDWVGIVLLVAGLTLALVAITRVGQGQALHDPRNAAGLGLGVAVLVAFGLHAMRVTEPIIPLSLVRQPIMVLCCGILFVAFSLFVAMSVLVPLRMQLVAGAQPGDAALAMLPYTLSNPIAAFVGGRWIYRHGRVVPLQRWGAILVVLALAALGLLSPTQSWPTGIALTFLGIGFGFQMPTTLLMMQNSVHHSLMGTATSLSAFFRLLGGAIGISVLSAVVLALLRGGLPAALASQGLENLGSLLGQAGTAAPQAAHAADMAFRVTMLGSAVFALINVYCTSKLPDMRVGAGRKPHGMDVE